MLNICLLPLKTNSETSTQIASEFAGVAVRSQGIVLQDPFQNRASLGDDSPIGGGSWSRSFRRTTSYSARST
jgi:hypothetical protein